MSTTEPILHAFGHLLGYASKLKMIPFHWNSKTSQLVQLEGVRHLWPSYFIAGQLCTRVAFLIINFLVKREELSKLYQLLHLFQTMAFSFGALCALYNVQRAFLFQNVINHFFKLQAHILSKCKIYGEEEDEENEEAQSQNFAKNIFVQSISGWPTYCSILTFLFLGEFIGNSSNSWYYYSLLGLPSSSPAIVPFAVFEYVDLLSLTSVIMLTGFTLMSYWFAMSTWLREIRYGNSRSQLHNAIQVPRISIRLYNAFYILNHELNLCFASGTLRLFQLSMIGFPVTMLHVVIRYYHILPLLFTLGLCSGTIICFFFIIYAYPMAADLNTHSISYLKTAYYGSTGDTYMIKLLKARQPLKVKIGSFFFVRRYTSFQVFGLIFYWTAKSLLLNNN